MKALGVERAGEFDSVRGAAHVDGGVALGRRRQVVDGRQVEQVVDLAPQLRHLLLLEAQQRPAQVADHGLDAVARGRARSMLQRSTDRRGAPRALADQHVDLPWRSSSKRSTRCASDEAGRRQ